MTLNVREKRGSAAAGVMSRYPLISYFVIAFAISWLIEATFVLSQDGSGLLPFKAPMSFMVTVGIATSAGPAISAFVVTAIVAGTRGVTDLFRRIVHWRVGLRWYLFVLVGLPITVTLGTIMLPGALASATPMDVLPELLAYVPFFVYPALIAGGPLGEEIGWRGFALPRLQDMHGPILASVILGVLWAVWHMPIWFSGHWTQPTIPNIALYVLWITAVTFIYTWVFNNTQGSVLMAILTHASMDAFPNAILWDHIPEATKMTNYGVLYGYWGLILGFGVFALLLLVTTRGRLDYDKYLAYLAARRTSG
jgi:membrane protease YdiL (CAAX protease family)